MPDITLKTVEDVNVEDEDKDKEGSSGSGVGRKPKIFQVLAAKTDGTVFEVSFSYVQNFNGMLNLDSDISIPSRLSVSGSRCKLPGSATQYCSRLVCLMAARRLWFMGALCRV